MAGGRQRIIGHPVPPLRRCPDCMRPYTRQGSRCGACVNYRKDHGITDPAPLGRVANGPGAFDPTLCPICHERPVPDVHGGQGRCRRCYCYYWHHGTERPRSTPTRYSRDGACVNCGAAPIRSLGRCHSCYYHWKRYGVDVDQAKRHAPWQCGGCGRKSPEVASKGRGLCPACYGRWRRALARGDDMPEPPLYYPACAKGRQAMLAKKRGAA